DALGAHLQRALCHRQDFHGIDTSVKYNLSRYFGVRGDLSLLYNKDRAADTFGDGADAHTDTSHLTERTYMLLAGVQFGDNAAGKWRPFAHALVGAARQTSVDRQTSTGPFNFTLKDAVTSFAMKVGGGIDVAIAPRVDVRL